ncbi:uncharacterized protein TRAVEDRAFT_70735 [Trametes versicolor FP-101664 SS1]|uniref:uncharacterized protein n=1 Tax=Trametes versicolor (strain FP-101664) TaxID=717944 RepID=UPI0004621257|nr:uncharacterized protein TRAVEDRAFT_70735 [Trametes versicolor FP-101664 SS1]EIW60306.1 hypothetical protein TRAVEDRAFT_70735 [Trametes versicolor FP-101664 SS1]
MFHPILPAPPKHASGQHQYGTRTRSNSAIKPSIRLRHSPDAPQSQRRIKPAPVRKARADSVEGPAPAPPPPDLPAFPPQHVYLHPEDAANKVFIALGRALMSVDNRAITVKDLAELSMKSGLMCQNVSAAGQAIATFIRTHYARCEAQDDQPLLLKHGMSGTMFDDDLVPALYSRVGGAHCTLNNGAQDRLTNFRRGTQVWYLSKAAGAPCPFARAGIRLCEYNEDGRIGTVPNPGKERKRERDRMRKAAQACGQKRKRLPRSCADKGPLTSDSSDDDEEERPPKVKLTLRLRPCLASTPGASSSHSANSVSMSPSASPQPEEDSDVEQDSDYDSDSDSMSVEEDEDDDMNEPGPALLLPSQRSPGPSRPFSLPQCVPPPLPGFPSAPETYRRSMSTPYSERSGSPPPDSEAEDDDYHITMTDARRLYSRSCASTEDEDSAWDGDFFGDVDVDAETQWDSPGPRSPSVQIEDEVVVKQEPTDVRGLLDAWEDLETRATDLKVIDIVAQAAAAERQMEEQAASDDLSKWSWPSTLPESTEHIKQEDVEPNLLFSDSEFSPPPDTESPLPHYDYDPYDSPVEERSFRFDAGSSYDSQWRDVEILGPDSVKPRDLEDGVWHEYRGRAVSPEEPIRSPCPGSSTAPDPSSPSSPKLSRAALPPLDVKSTDVGANIAQGRNMSITSPSLLASLTSLYIRSPTIPAASTQRNAGYAVGDAPASAPSTSCVRDPSEDEPLVVHTVHELEPAISATQFEGVPVYQMTLGSSLVLRRIDTDFVNASPIAQRLRVSCPSAPNAVAVMGGSPSICGTWVPLDVARTLAKGESALETFLSYDLRCLFPPSLNAVHPVGDRQPASSGYGHQFKSASEARRQSMTSHRLELPPREFEVSWEDHLSTHPSFILATSALDGHRPAMEEAPLPVVETLSPTEEAMFHVLCADPEWDEAPRSPTEEHAPEVGDTAIRPADTTETPQDRPLRRSKRVANTVTTRSRTRSSKRGSRTSLS